jgi:hypothetical protein
VAYLIVAVIGLAFGVADQYLGSRSIVLGLWASTAAQMSAPWLLLAFSVGITQQRARRAVVLGLVVTASAPLGYFAMTYSPLEIRIWTFHRFTSGMVAVTTTGYNPAYIAAGLVTGPVFGWLGHRWRVRRSLISAVLVAGALCLEPLARWITGQLSPPAPVWTVEVALGAVVAAIFAYAILARRGERTALPD